MSNQVLIDIEKLNVLRRSLEDALEFIQGLEARELTAPKQPKKITKKERVNKYLDSI